MIVLLLPLHLSVTHSAEFGIDLESAAHEAECAKAGDDMGYVPIYAMLFDAVRHRVRNVTEIGVHLGRSLRMWHRYFGIRTHLYGIDINLQEQAHAMVKSLGREGARRIHLSQGDSRDAALIRRLHMRPNSMDIIIDDGKRWWLLAHDARIASRHSFSCHCSLTFRHSPLPCRRLPAQSHLSSSPLHALAQATTSPGQTRARCSTFGRW